MTVRPVRAGNLGRLEAQVWTKVQSRRDTARLMGPMNPESKSGKKKKKKERVTR